MMCAQNGVCFSPNNILNSATIIGGDVFAVSKLYNSQVEQPCRTAETGEVLASPLFVEKKNTSTCFGGVAYY